VALLALVAALGLGALVHLNADAPGVHPANLIHPGATGPSAAAVRADFPGHPLPEGLGHDGQQYYAVARDPFDLQAAAEHLDRPRYRLQRMAFPLAAWALHPVGGGSGLVLALFAVGVAAVFAGAFATGALSVRLGGTPLPALVFALAPGAWMALRFTMADSLALAAAIGALALSLAGRHRWAVLAAVVAVLAKESLFLLPLGLAIAYRDRARLALVAVPAAVASAWWAALHLLVDDQSEGVIEFTYPFGGLIDSARYWAEGNAPLAMLTVPGTLLFGLYALARAGRHHPLAAALALQLAFVPLLGRDVLGLDANGTRMTMPLLALAVVAVSSQNARVGDELAGPVDRDRTTRADDPPDGASTVGPSAVNEPAGAPDAGL
jgi:hypothetical protein